MGHPDTQFIPVRNGAGEDVRIAYQHMPAASFAEPGLVWFPGLNSNMTSTKVSALKDWAEHTNRSMLCFDYSGHGASGGDFKDGTIGQWLGECLAILRHAANGPQILVGSSMGGWLVLLILRAIAAGDAIAERLCPVEGAVLIAPAWDMTEELMWKEFPEEARKAIEVHGFCERPSRYGDGPYVVTRRLIEEGRSHLIADSRFKPPCPVRIIQGIDDPDVPWRHVNRLNHMLEGENVMLNFIQDGDHRLSRPKDIDTMLYIIDDLYRSLAECRLYL